MATKIKGEKIRDSGREPINGFLRVTLDAVVIDGREVHTTEFHEFSIIMGNCEFELEETETANVSCLFEIFKSWSVIRYFYYLNNQRLQWLGSVQQKEINGTLRYLTDTITPQELQRVEATDSKKLVEWRSIIPKVPANIVVGLGQLFPTSITTGNLLEVSLYRLQQELAQRTADGPGLILQAAEVQVSRNTLLNSRNVQSALEEIGREFLKVDRAFAEFDHTTRQTARRNLGLGSMAGKRASDYALADHQHGSEQIFFEFTEPGIGEGYIGNIPAGVFEGEPSWVVVRGANGKRYAVPAWGFVEEAE